MYIIRSRESMKWNMMPQCLYIVYENTYTIHDTVDIDIGNYIYITRDRSGRG